MDTWNEGYVTETDYTYGYYAELAPARLRLPFLWTGIAAPRVARACELGYGQGISVNIHAAATGARWHGTDFNPAQADFALGLARISENGARLSDQSFAEFCARDDLPEFDFVGLHGIWSWISDDNRAAIVDFLRRKLRVGGVLYISYNTMPGWAAMLPMRELLLRYADCMGIGGVLERVDTTLDFADRLLATNPAFAAANPQIVTRLEAMRGQDRQYVAHEYFNREWEPMTFSRMAEWLSPARLDFACSAFYPNLVDVLNLSDEQRAFLAEIHDPVLRETARDFMCNTQFRKDYWVRGRRALPAHECREALEAERIMLLTP
ncbi:MAG: methyltransferase regulatory domain-containing protein, partial [Desulfovibrionaceae bacterium]|nr:methyltransferase regulatory domain-containing protein [Desulfovibrionaceae bacterium]